MSFLQTLKEALQSRIGQAVIGGIPEVITAGAEIAADPNAAIQILAHLVETELGHMNDTIAENHNALMAQISQANSVSSVDAGTAFGPTDIAHIVEQVMSAINPTLAQYAPIIDLVAQHFPHLQPAPVSVSPAVAAS